jgi:hypothetical protein
MYKSSTYLLVTYFSTHLPIYETYFPTELVTKVKPNITSVEVHPELSHNGHPLCTGWCWFTVASSSLYISASEFFWGAKLCNLAT